MGSLLDLNSADARDFFLKGTSYCSIDLPPYIQFDEFIQNVFSKIKDKQLNSCYNQIVINDKTKHDCPSLHENVCYKLLSNKDGKYAWRPLQIIHPVLYCQLVELITTENNWNVILERFNTFYENENNIECVSIPVISTSEKSDKAESILNWWQEIEQRSIKLSLEYDCVLITDITDCYGAIYTHSISWALHSRAVSKNNRGKKPTLLGDEIDSMIRKMVYGQTNGIPQGSALMDLIAEIILGYADMKLAKELKDQDIVNYKILRYRDDYRIFGKNQYELELIAKTLSEVLANLGLKLNSSKTTLSSDIIKASIKSDKLSYISNTPIYIRNKLSVFTTIQKELLFIYDFSTKYPNSGTIYTLLTKLYKKRIYKAKKIDEDLNVLVSIIVEVVYKNPRVYSIGFAIIAKLMTFNDEDKECVINAIKDKFCKLPNIELMQLWLQRLTKPLGLAVNFDESICKLINGEEQNIWNSTWLHTSLISHVNPKGIIDQKILSELSPVFEMSEIDVFEY